MKIIYSRIIPFRGYVAVNLFGILFVQKFYQGRTLPVYTLNHEAIHTEQMKETLYIGFYILYLIFWIFRLLTPPCKTAYKDISFEQEAYLNQDDLNYLKTRRPYAWISYQFTSYAKSRNLKKI